MNSSISVSCNELGSLLKSLMKKSTSLRTMLDIPKDSFFLIVALKFNHLLLWIINVTSETNLDIS